MQRGQLTWGVTDKSLRSGKGDVPKPLARRESLGSVHCLAGESIVSCVIKLEFQI